MDIDTEQQKVIDRDTEQAKVINFVKKTCLPKYMRIQQMFIKNKYNSNTLYTLT
jgi:hypothetical protein